MLVTPKNGTACLTLALLLGALATAYLLRIIVRCSPRGQAHNQMGEVPLSKTLRIFGAEEKTANTVYFFHEPL